jgi:hypothetical protein
MTRPEAEEARDRGLILGKAKIYIYSFSKTPGRFWDPLSLIHQR